LTTVLALAPSLPAQETFDTVQVRTERLADGLFMLRARGGNIGLSVGADGAFLVDDQYAPLTPKILQAIRAVTDLPVRFVLNTHWHGDHTGGNENLGRSGTVIVAHDNVRRRMSAAHLNEFFKTETPASPAGARPIVTFNDSVTFHLNGDEIRAHHVRTAHTDGDAIVRFTRVNVIHMGDVYFATGYPFVDFTSGGSIDGLIAAVASVLAGIDARTRVIPGHGPMSDRAGLLRYHDMLVTVRDRIRDRKRSGASLAQVIAARPTAEFDAEWGQAFIKPDQFVELVYRTVAAR
jgi:glyoxylase-like metal-dependent hydrolase (beta-lactamase superfamily II)